MDKIDEKIEKYLNERNLESLMPSEDEEYEINEELKELAKLFGGKFIGDGVVVYPFKKGDDWEVYITVDDYNPLEYGIIVSFLNAGMGTGGDISVATDEINEKIIKEIGRLQKLYYDTNQTIINSLGKMGSVDV